jgi:hypothetical protein
MFKKSALKISLLTILAATFITGTALAQVPAATSSPASSTTEDPSITAAAKAFYDQLLLGKVDRSKLSATVNSALTDSIVAALAKQLGGFGTPKWEYLKQVKAGAGTAQAYKLSYSGPTLYLTFGVSQGGTIFSVFFGAQEPVD